MGYLLAIIAFIALLGGAAGIGASKATQKVKEHYEPLLATASAERQTAITENKRLGDKLKGVEIDINACNTNVATIKANSDQAIKDMKELKALSDANKAALNSILAKYKAGAANTSVPPSLQCAEASRVLSDLSDTMLDALGLSTTIAPGRLSISPTAPPKSAIKLPGAAK